MISIRKKSAGAKVKVTPHKSGFFNLSQKVDYGMFLMSVLAESRDKIVSLREVANSNHISFFFLQKIAVDLKKKGLIKAMRGKSGGYKLGKPANEVKIISIIEALEGPVALLSCLSNDNCGRGESCNIKNGFGMINRIIVDAFEKFTLSDFLHAKKR